MKMNRISKMGVNRQDHVRKQIDILERLLGEVDLEPHIKALDIGCGAGGITTHFATKYKVDATGIDVDPEQVERAKKLHGDDKYVDFLVGDAAALPFDDSEFDLVFSQKVFHHVNAWREALEEVNRVLKPGGSYIFDDISFEGRTADIIKPAATRMGLGIYKIEEIKQLLGDLGFKVIYEEKPHGLFFKNCLFVYRKNG